MLYIILWIVIILLTVVFRKKPKKYKIDLNLFNNTIKDLKEETKKVVK